MAHQLVFEIDAADPLAAGFDQVLRTILNHHRAIEIDGRNVTGIEPAVVLRCRGSGGVVVVAARDPGTANQQSSGFAGSPRQFGSLVIFEA